MIYDEFASGQELSLEKLFNIHPMHHLRQAIGLGGGASALGKSMKVGNSLESIGSWPVFNFNQIQTDKVSNHSRQTLVKLSQQKNKSCFSQSGIAACICLSKP